MLLASYQVTFKLDSVHSALDNKRNSNTERLTIRKPKIYPQRLELMHTAVT